MNKYTLGTIVGTALLALAKKHSGSSVKIMPAITETWTFEYSFGVSPIPVDEYNPRWEYLVDNQYFTDETFNNLKNDLKEEGTEKKHSNLPGMYIYMDSDLFFINDYDEIDNTVDKSIYLRVNLTLIGDLNSFNNAYRQDAHNRMYHNKLREATTELFNIEKNKLIKNMRERYDLEPIWESSRIEIDNGDFGFFIQRNGKWVPYEAPTSKSNLRKR